MQNKNKRNPYVHSGASSQQPTKKKRKLSRFTRKVLLIVLAAALLISLISFIPRLFKQSGTPIRINAQPTDNIQAFGENILLYDGVTLHCLAPTGSVKWQYTLGADGDFSCNQSMIVAWSGTQIHVLNKDGRPTFTDRMPDTVRFARIGSANVAVCIGSDLGSTVRVMTHTGAMLENEAEAFASLYLLDIGFFFTNDQFMWVLGLDVNGNAPISSLSTYAPGDQFTGGVELQDELVYHVYSHNNMLMVVDTSRIRTFNYKCVEQSDPAPVLSYGWQVRQERTVGRNTYALLEKMPTVSSSNLFSELRVITNYTPQSYRLLTPCFAGGLSEKGVYGFGSNVIYYAPYGSTMFKTTTLNYIVDGLVCMLDKGRAVMTAGSDVIIVTLPT